MRVRARLRDWLGAPHDLRWMVAPMSSEVMNALERTGVGHLTTPADAR
jgi:hypothetical protein